MGQTPCSGYADVVFSGIVAQLINQIRHAFDIGSCRYRNGKAVIANHGYDVEIFDWVVTDIIHDQRRDNHDGGVADQ